jgi:isopentenyl diphosphate isomerase/L-lactate dehydrogenase-like FMN-dependent dehydrogenase
MYGLAGGSTAGAADVLRILRDEMLRAMTMMGRASVSELDHDALVTRWTSGEAR